VTAQRRECTRRSWWRLVRCDTSLTCLSDNSLWRSVMVLLLTATCRCCTRGNRASVSRQAHTVAVGRPSRCSSRNALRSVTGRGWALHGHAAHRLTESNLGTRQSWNGTDRAHCRHASIIILHICLVVEAFFSEAAARLRHSKDFNRGKESQGSWDARRGKAEAVGPKLTGWVKARQQMLQLWGFVLADP